MIVRILKETPYTPAKDDSTRCYGQLRMRATWQDGTAEGSDGKKFGIKIRGGLERYFPVGATPDLKNEVASEFITAGRAEACDLDVRMVSISVILDGMLETK